MIILKRDWSITNSRNVVYIRICFGAKKHKHWLLANRKKEKQEKDKIEAQTETEKNI